MADGKIDPISQFEVERWIPLEIGGIDLSFTNASFFMLMAAVLVIGMFMIFTSSKAMVPTRSQSVGELSYEFIASTIRQTAGEDGLKFFPFVFTLFFLIFAANLVGMVPYFFTTTSHLAVTGALAITVFLLVTLYGVFKHGLGFLRLFLPKGTPILIAPILIVVEIISYFARPVTLSMRLFANMLAGHIMLKLMATFAGTLAGLGGLAVLAPLPFIMAIAITALEFLVAFLQAYVFAILTCVYLADALHPGHH